MGKLPSSLPQCGMGGREVCLRETDIRNPLRFPEMPPKMWHSQIFYHDKWSDVVLRIGRPGGSRGEDKGIPSADGNSDSSVDAKMEEEQ